MLICPFWGSLSKKEYFLPHANQMNSYEGPESGNVQWAEIHSSPQVEKGHQGSVSTPPFFQDSGHLTLQA